MAGRDGATIFSRSSRTGMARLNAGEIIRSIAAALAIAPSCVSKWKKRLAETGAPTRGRVGRAQAADPSGERADWLRQRCRSNHDAGACGELAERGIKTEGHAVWVFVQAEGLGFKKRVLPTKQMAKGSMPFQPMERPIGRKSLASPAPKRPKVQRPIPGVKGRGPPPIPVEQSGGYALQFGGQDMHLVGPRACRRHEGPHFSAAAPCGSRRRSAGGVRLPIGLPAAYARALGATDFRTALLSLGAERFALWFDVAELVSQSPWQAPLRWSTAQCS